MSLFKTPTSSPHKHKQGMAFKSRDCALLAALMQVTDVDSRAVLVQNLHPSSLEALCSHLKNVIAQKRTHRISNENVRSSVSQALQPHSRVIKRITSGKGAYGNLRKQRGGALFSILLSAVVPLLAQMAISAISKKLNKKK